MEGFTLTQKEYTNLKARLTRRLKKRAEDPHALLKEAEHGLAVFREKGFPDDWHRWECARDDAQLTIKFGKKQTA